MASFERVLTGRRARHGAEPWPGHAGWRPPVPGGRQAVESPPDPMVDPAIQAALAEAVRAAEERAFAMGRQGAEQELAHAITAAQAFAHKLETAVPRDIEMEARTVAELAVLIARRILGAELRHDPSVLVAAIEAGLRQAAGASVIHVELHPAVVDAVEAVWLARHGARYRGFSWSFTGDPTLPRDGCRIRTEHGLVEAGFEDQLSEVATALDLAIPGYLVSVLGGAAERGEATGSGTTPARTARPARTVRAARPARVAGHPIPGAVGPAAARRTAAGAPDDPDLDGPDSLGFDGPEDFLAEAGA